MKKEPTQRESEFKEKENKHVKEAQELEGVIEEEEEVRGM